MDSTKWKIRLALLVTCFLLLNGKVSSMAVPSMLTTHPPEHVAAIPGYEFVNGRQQDLAESNNEHLTSNHMADGRIQPISENFLESKRNEASGYLEARNALDGTDSHSNREEHVEQNQESGSRNEVEPVVSGAHNNNDHLEPGQIPNIPDSHTYQNGQDGDIRGGSRGDENQNADHVSHDNTDGDLQTEGRTDNSIDSNGNEQVAPGEIPIITGNQANERLQPGYHDNSHESIETGETQHNPNTNENGDLAPGEIPEIPGIHGDQNEHLQPGLHGNSNEETDREETQNNHNNENGHIAPGEIPHLPGFHGEQQEHGEIPLNGGGTGNESEPVEPGPGPEPEPIEPQVVPENGSELQVLRNHSEIELTTLKPIEHAVTDQIETPIHEAERVGQITPSPSSLSAITEQGETIQGDTTSHALLSSYSEVYGNGLHSLGIHPNLPSAHHQIMLVSASASSEHNTQHGSLNNFDSSTRFYTNTVNMAESVDICDNLCSQQRNMMAGSESLGSPATSISPSSVSLETDSSSSWKHDDKLAHKNEKNTGLVDSSEETVSTTPSLMTVSSAIGTPQSVESISSSIPQSVESATSSTNSAQSVEHISSSISTARSTESIASPTGRIQPVENISSPTSRVSLSSTSVTTSGTIASPGSPSSTTSLRSGYTTTSRLRPLTGEVVSLPSGSHEIIIQANTTLSHVTLSLTTPKPDNETESNNSSIVIITQKMTEKRTFAPTMSFLSTLLHRSVTSSVGSRTTSARTSGIPRQTTSAQNFATTANQSVTGNFNSHSTRNMLQPTSGQKTSKQGITTTSATRNATLRNNDSRLSTATTTSISHPNSAHPGVSSTAVSANLNHSTWPTRPVVPSIRSSVTLTHTTSRPPFASISYPRETTLGVSSTTLNTGETRSSGETTKQMTTMKRSTFLPFITSTPSASSSTVTRLSQATHSTSTPSVQLTSATTPTSLTSTSPITASPRVFPSDDLSTRKGHPTPMPSPSVFATVKLRMTWNDFCDNEGIFRLELVDIFHRHARRDVKTTQIMFVNINIPDCVNIMSPEDLSEHIDLKMYLVDVRGRYDSLLTIACCEVIERGFNANKQSYFRDKLVEVKLNRPLQMATPHPKSDGFVTEPGIIIAIVIASVGGLCCITLIMLQVIIRRRYAKKSQSCPTSSRQWSFTSTDSIALGSVNKARPNSGVFNPGLDPTSLVEPSVPVNLTSLANKCLDVLSLYEEFHMIPNYTPRLSTVPIGAEDKNRYANVIPIPHTRVKLKKVDGQAVSDYINANYITGYMDDKRAYIATQAPMTTTVPDFWRMVWEQQCRVIVMLTAMDEQGHPKCAPYWPDSENDPLRRYCDFMITLKKKDVYQEYTVSSLELKDMENNLIREIKHFWYTCWPVHGIPEPISLVKFVLDTRPYYEDSGAPLIVHCSPGTGRTGTLITLDICMRQFENKRMVDIMACVHQMRQERAGVIQTKEQYALIHMALNEYACVLTTPAISASSSSATLQTVH